jgi:hypothetical protein
MKIGQQCVVVASDDFYAAIDGWPVVVVAVEGLTATSAVPVPSRGMAWVEHTDSERVARFIVPIDQLRPVVQLN